jgi:hypothetical protein
MTNVMRAYQKQQFQLLHDAPHRVVRRLALDVEAFLERADVDRSTYREVLNRHLRAIRRQEYRGCRAPPPKEEEEGEEQHAEEDDAEAEAEAEDDDEEVEEEVEEEEDSD